MSIRIFYDKVSSRYKGWRKLNKILKQIITGCSLKPGNLDVIITDDITVRNINIEFLEHDYYTDVITFNYNSEQIVNGEIYISIDTVHENASNYKISFNDEMSRVIIHGVLHLTGFDDKSETDKARMRETEDYWLGKLREI